LELAAWRLRGCKEGDHVMPTTEKPEWEWYQPFSRRDQLIAMLGRLEQPTVVIVDLAAAGSRGW